MPATNPPTDPVEALQWLVDHEAIRNLVYDFATSIDDQDRPRYLANFTEDAVVTLPHGRIEGRAELAKMPEPRPEWAAQHLFGGIVIDLDGDTAHTRAYLAATHIFDRTDVKNNAHSGGWYEHTAVRTPEGWRFSELKLVILWEGQRSMTPPGMDEPH